MGADEAEASATGGSPASWVAGGLLVLLAIAVTAIDVKTKDPLGLGRAA
jgi:hypothetical protein